MSEEDEIEERPRMTGEDIRRLEDYLVDVLGGDQRQVYRMNFREKYRLLMDKLEDE